ncbi:hypothetical protein ACJJTC_001850 [Scirpophaga incertulas]
MAKWTDNTTMQFVEEYLRHEEADLKIKSIRSTYSYSQEIKKMKNSTASGSGTDDLYKSNLKWFKILDEALKSVNIAEIRKTQNNMVLSQFGASIPHNINENVTEAEYLEINVQF